jgi:hypothetical protein
LFLQIQITFWAVGGVCVLALAITDIWHRRDAGSWLLGLWVIGTFLFAAIVNWTVNGRSILPMAPAVGILLVRRLERLPAVDWNPWPRGVVTGLVAGAILAMLVTWADFQFAKAVRKSAQQTFAKHALGSDRFWFQGHWGFQYYMDTLGAPALDEAHTLLKRGDIVATPVNNTNFQPLNPDLVVLRELLTVPGPQFLTTMKGEVGAGFYASLRGPLPFAFGLVPPETVVVCAIDPVVSSLIPDGPRH